MVCFSKQVLPTNPRDEEYEDVVVEEEGNNSDSDMSDWCYKPLLPGGRAYQLRMQYEARRAVRTQNTKRFGTMFSSHKKSLAVAPPRVIPPRELAGRPAPSCAPRLPCVIPPRAIASPVVKKNEADGQNMKDASAECMVKESEGKKMTDASGMEDQNMSSRNEMAADREFDDGATEYVPTSEVPTSEMASSDEEVGPEEVDIMPARGWYVPL